MLATGAGKTIIFASAPRYLRRATGLRTRRVLILAHREELLAQAAAKCHWVEPRARILLHRGRQKATAWREAHIVVASVLTIIRDLAAFDRNAFDLIVVDEAHHCTEESVYRDVLEYFGAFEPNYQTITLGLTATPNRADGQSLATIFEAMPFAATLADGMQQGWLTPVSYRPVPIGADLLQAGNGHDFDRSKLAKLMDAEEITLTVLGRYLQLREEWRRDHGHPPKTIGFAVTRDHAAHVIAAARTVGIDARYVGGDSTDRREVLRAFARREFELLVSVNLLLEGFDDPDVDGAIDIKPTRSLVLAVQELGRIVRLAEGKRVAFYMQAVPVHSAEAQMKTVPEIFGIAPTWIDTAPDLVADGPLHELPDRVADHAAIEELLAEVTAEEFAEWSPTDRAGWLARVMATSPEAACSLVVPLPEACRVSDVLWQSHLDGHFSIPLGTNGAVRLEPADVMGIHRVVFASAAGEREEIGVGCTVEEAQRFCERWVVRQYPEAGFLYRKSLAERWMRKPATEAQRARVRQLYPEFRLQHLQRLRRGVASRLIDLKLPAHAAVGRVA